MEKTKRPTKSTKAKAPGKKRYVSPQLIKNEPLVNVDFGATATGTTLPGTATTAI